MRGRTLVVISALAACGDNRKAPGDAPRDTAVRCEPVRGRTVTARKIAHGCNLPAAPSPPLCLNGIVTLVTSPPDDPRLFVLEATGAIRIIRDGELRAASFLDLSVDPAFTSGGELGLLGLAFHPEYATNRQLYVFYTALNPDTADTAHPYLNVLERYVADPQDPDRAVPGSRQVLLSILDPYANHNAGMIEFGADGFLYVSTGDGGSDASVPADPFGHAQNPSSLLGKVLRLDVDHPAAGTPYGIPLDNPYAAGGGAPEVWMRGLRNPWRFSFDRKTGDLWLADVGAATVEEIDVLRPDQQRGANLGWSMWEGRSCYNAPCDEAGMTFPLHDHQHTEGFAAIIGGEVYRGACFPDLVGTYFYTDTYRQYLRSAHLAADGTLVLDPEGEFIGLPTSLHGDAYGELYVTTVPGDVYQLVVVP